MMHEGPTYRIGEIAELTGVSVEALRYYEHRGLLTTPLRTDGGLRRYGRDVVAQVSFIKQAQALGLSLEEIHQLVEGHRHGTQARCRRVHDLLARRIAELDQRMAELKALRRTLVKHHARCAEALHRGSEPPCPTLSALDAQSIRTGGGASKRGVRRPS